MGGDGGGEEVEGFVVAGVEGLDDEIAEADVGEALVVGDGGGGGGDDAGLLLLGVESGGVVAVALGLGGGLGFGQDQVAGEVGREHRGRVAADLGAVAVEHGEFGADVGGVADGAGGVAGAEIRGVGEARDLEEGGPFAAPRNQ